MTRLEKAKQVDCNVILQESGYDIKNISGGKNFYLAPWRSEDDPSLVVFSNNSWKDFGSGERGDAIDLYERIYKVDISTAIKNMMDEQYEEFEQKVVEKEPGTVIEDVKELTSSTLLAYLKTERKINPDIAKLYLKEIYVRFPLNNYPNKIHKAIGFANDRGGWEIRNGYLKVGSTPKHYTTIEGNGRECAVFEGWPDFLTLLTWTKRERLEQDVFVYNSTSFYKISVPVLKKYSMNYLFLDNDDTGKGLARDLKNDWVWCKDFSYKYDGFNDLNEWWFNK